MTRIPATIKQRNMEAKTTKLICVNTKSESENSTLTKWTDNKVVIGLTTEPIIKIKAAERYHELYSNLFATKKQTHIATAPKAATGRISPINHPVIGIPLPNRDK